MPNYPVPYQNNWNSGGIGQQMYPQYPQYPQSGSMSAPQTSQGMQYGPGLIWVDGEVGAKAFQMPAGWPANQPIDLWDTNDTIIYLKSVNQFGMPNPLQKAHYTLEEHRSASMSGTTQQTQSGDTEDYVKKEDLERVKQEIMDAIGNGTSGAAASRRGTKGE